MTHNVAIVRNPKYASERFNFGSTNYRDCFVALVHKSRCGGSGRSKNHHYKASAETQLSTW
ncbi:hypothetical protein PUN28_012549 [Cardiocondyla obscurior]|uniref:Uncharacterized protein n=1 Tax=Cardiocondyla obscurior TaxID=286306 RepID=A0AAW2FBZ9_9HYME